MYVTFYLQSQEYEIWGCKFLFEFPLVLPEDSFLLKHSKYYSYLVISMS